MAVHTGEPDLLHHLMPRLGHAAARRDLSPSPVLPTREACRRLLLLLSALLSERLGWWAKRIASTSIISAGMSRHMSELPLFTTGRPRCIDTPRDLRRARRARQSDREHDLADREAQEADADRREAAAEPEDLPPDP